MIVTDIKISDQLLRFRTQAGFTRQQVAEKLGCTTSAICQWENGKRQPDADTLIQLIHIYDVSTISEFFGEPQETSTHLTDAEKMLLSLYREATYECKNIVNLILKNYRKK